MRNDLRQHEAIANEPAWSPAEAEWLKNVVQPVSEPSRVSLSGFTTVSVWQADISMSPVDVAPGRLLSGSETWNGKALVHSSRPDGTLSNSEVVGEVEIVQRFRNAKYDAYWSGGNKRWLDYTLRSSSARLAQISALDAILRPLHPLLRDRKGGWPDVVAWHPRGELYLIEYKGPSPSKPRVQDTIYDHQAAWMESAVREGMVRPTHCAVVRWLPTPQDSALLMKQAAAKEPKPSRRTE